MATSIKLQGTGLFQDTTEVLDLKTNGSVKTHAAVASSGSITAGTLITTGSMEVGGGYGSTGATLSAAGVGQFNGALTTDGALTADNIVCTNAATFGGGFGATGVTIATDGAISANGLASLDGGINVDDAFVASAAGVISAGTWQGTAIASAYLDADTQHLSIAQTVSGKKTFSSVTDLDGGIDVNDSAFTVATNGTIGAGTWQGGVIASAYLDADTAHLSTNQTFSGTKTFSAEAQLDAGFDVNASKLAVSSAGKLVTVDNVNAQAILTSHNINCSGSLLIGDNDIVLNGTAVTSTGAELNLVDGSAANTVVNSKAVIYGSAGEVKATTLTTTSNASVSGSLHVVGNLDVQGSINSVTKTTSTLEVEDLNIVCASGSNASDSNGAGFLIGGTVDGPANAVAGLVWDNDHANLQFLIGGTEIAQVSAAAFAVTGTLNASGDAKLGNDLALASDSAVLSFGADGDTTLTHTDGTGLTLNSTNKLCFGRATTLIQEASANALMIGSAGTITAASPTVVITATTAMTLNDGSNTAKLRINGASANYGLNLPNTATHGEAQARSWITFSDGTLKKNIEPMANGLEKVMAMQPVTYQYKSGGGQEVGFVAQQMQEVVPEVVYGSGDGNLGIDYSKITSVLVEAIKTQQEQIEDLKSVVVKLSDNS